MNYITYRVSLDMFDTSSQTTIKAKKGDSACKIIIALTKNGKIYKINEGCYATFNGKKSDGTFVYDNCTIEDGNIVYTFTSSVDENGVCQISAAEGIVECEVTLYKGDSEQLTSPRFTLIIDGTVYNGEEITSSPEANVLKELIKEADDAVNSANNMVADIEQKLANGEFIGDKGDTYVLTKADKTEIADIVKQDEIVGEIETALDSIIAIQESLIGNNDGNDFEDETGGDDEWA